MIFKKKNYRYFISYAHENGFGNVEVTLNYRIKGNKGAIRDVQEWINKNYSVGSAVILYFRYLGRVMEIS